MNDQTRFEVILESIEGKLEAILEVVTPHGPRIMKIEERLDGIESDVSAIKSVVTHQNRDITALKAQR